MQLRKESYEDYQETLKKHTPADQKYYLGLLYKEGAYFGWQDSWLNSYLANPVTSYYYGTTIIYKDEKMAARYFQEAKELGHFEAEQQLELINFKKDYLRQYSSTLFRNPLSYMRNHMDAFKTLQKVEKYAQEYPETRTAKVFVPKI